jgi:hypothetical protein
MTTCAKLAGDVLLHHRKQIEIEVRRMATPSPTCNAPGCGIEIPESLKYGGLCLVHYLEEAFQKLDEATYHFRTGHGAGYDTLDWLLAQVDFMVGAMSDESTTFDEYLRSKLLELLLGIANLNEYIRHQTVVARLSH